MGPQERLRTVEHAHAAVGELREHLEPELDAVERAADVEPPDGDVPGPEQAGGHRRIDEVGRDSPVPPGRGELDVRLLRPADHADEGHRGDRPCGAGRRHP